MSQAGIINASSQSGLVDSVTGTNGIVASPTSGNVVVSLVKPNSIVNLVDDFFCSGSNSVSIAGQLQWKVVPGNFSVVTSTTSSAHPGIIQFGTGSATVGIKFCAVSTNNNFILGGGILNCNFVANLVGLSSGGSYTAQIGMTDDLTGTTSIQNGVYFSYSDNVNAGNWVINCAKSGTITSVNTSTAADTNFHNFGFVVNAAASSVSFFIDGVAVGSAITTNIPTAVINPYFFQIYSSGSLPGTLIDLFYLQYVLTTPR